MRIAVIGAGAMGSIYAALMADAGNEVIAVDAWKEHVDAINRDGLRVEGASGDRTVRLRATTDPASVGLVDLAIVATKARDVRAAADVARRMLGPDTAVLAIQNGLGSAERIAKVLERGRILLGVIGGFGASMRGPGHAHHNGMEFLKLGEVDGGITPRLTRVAEMWRTSGFKVEAVADIQRLVWEKFICNVAFSGPCGLTGRTVGEMIADPDGWAMSSGCAAEAFAVARAKRIAISFDDPVAHVRAFGEKIPNARPSLLLDHLAERRSEIDAINGAVPPAAAEVGLSVPINTVVSALVRAKELKFK
ncbi:MAG: 2-dehydropantoate 2-reductase [Alphaproteobacteria bacterium]|nr:2-dehydropantoate 2-reductase [Alphaproteobacteria bacterium]